MSNSEVSRMLQIATKVVPQMKNKKADIPFKQDNDNDGLPVNKFPHKKSKGPKENPSRLQQKMEIKKTIKKERQEVSEANGDSTTVEKTTETTTEKTTENVQKFNKNKTKKQNKKKLNAKRPESYNVEEYSSNWEKFLKKQKVDDKKTKTKTIEKVVVKKVKKVQENVKLTPACPIPGSYAGLTPYVALDCEMVLVEGNVHALARCSIVNYNGHALYDKYIRPQQKVTNFLTKVSGITPAKLRTAETFDKAREEILNIMKGRIIVGHTLKSDFEVLKYEPDEKNVRDITHLKSLKENGKTVGLKKLTEMNLKYRIQTGEHDSVEDARAAMALYRLFEKKWEEDLKKEGREPKPRKAHKPKSKSKEANEGKETKEVREVKEVKEVEEEQDLNE